MKSFLLTLLCAFSALAQWPSSPTENLLICDHPGEQALPKIAATSDGGCYITWWDLASGNYDVYLQRLDADGVPLWTNPCGILVSDYPQATWLTDWDMAVDASDNCVIAVNDIRNGDDRDITAYLISPQQEFLWGADGIALSNNDGFEADPRILPIENGDIVFAWQDETFIHVRMLDGNGNDAFDPATIYFTQANGVSIPRLAALDNHGFALSYLAQQGTQFTSPRYLYVRSYNSDGSNRWVEPGIEIMNQSGIGVQMRPDLVSDGAGGVYVYWYDARGNVHHCYVQHIENDGVAHWTANGVSVDASASELQMSPSAVNTGFGVVIFYQSANTNQSQGGVEAQYLSPTGQLNWNANGVTIAPLSAEPCFNVKAYVQNGNYSVFYSQYAPGSAINTLLRASQLGEAGQSTWNPSIQNLCTVASEKGRPNACINSAHQIIAAWPDSRTASMDMYLQNINSNGTLGPIPNQSPSISITIPTEGSVVHEDTVSLLFDVDHFDLDPNNGDGYVILIVNGTPTDTLSSEDPYPVEVLVGENQILVYLVDRQYQSLDPSVSDFVNVHYAPLIPRITITYPAAPPETLFYSDDLPIFVHFEVEDFVISDPMGDGRVRLQVRVMDEEDPFDVSEHVVFDSIEVPLWYFATNEIVLSLVDNSGTPLVPSVADTAYVRAWQISADPIPDGLPAEFSISSAYPNPFNSTLTIQYDVPNQANISLSVYDLLGRNVTTLYEGSREPGRHTLQWHAESAASGVYFIRLNNTTVAQSHKVLLLK